MDTDQALRGTFDDPDHELLLLETGFRKPLSALVMSDVAVIRRTVKNHMLMRVKAELDQFMKGLAVCGVAHAIRRHPELMAPRFVHTPVQLSRGEKMGLKSLECCPMKSGCPFL